MKELPLYGRTAWLSLENIPPLDAQVLAHFAESLDTSIPTNICLLSTPTSTSTALPCTMRAVGKPKKVVYAQATVRALEDSRRGDPC